MISTCLRNARVPVLALALAIAGCSAVPRSHTTLVFTGLSGEPDSLNPILSSSADVLSLSHLYMSGLVESNARGELVPDVASSVPTQSNGGISPDGRTIVYYLRPHVLWQDGVLLTASDVAFTYRAIMNPANNLPTRVGYSEVASLRTPDARTVVVRLRRPFSPFTSYFCGPQGFSILPAHLLAQYHDLNRVPYDERPVGSGAYRVVQWRRGDSITFEANPSYWRGKPHIPRLVYRVIPDPSTRLAQLRTGEVDAYFDVDPQLLPQAAMIPGVDVLLTPVNDVHVIDFNVTDPLVSDVRVRKAITLAIDRAKLIVTATHGAGIALDGDQPVNGWAYVPTRVPASYDPVAARALLYTAGWREGPGGVLQKDGRPLEVTLAIAPQGINGSPLVATQIQRYLRDAGIAATIKTYTPGQYWAPKAANGILSSGRYQLAYDAWWVLGPDPDDSWQFACDQIPPAGYNHYFWCDRRADTLMQDALRSYDRSRRRRDYAAVQAILRRDLPELTLWQVRMPVAFRRGLHGVAPSPFGSTFWNAWEWSLDGS